MFGILVGSWLALAGCVVPTPLQREADGGNSAPPQIERGITVPQVGQTFTEQQTPEGAPQKNRRLVTVGLSDADSPTLYARVFIDNAYDLLVQNGERTASGCVGEDQSCAAVFTLVGLCDEMVNNITGPHVLEVYVSDRQWPDDAESGDLRTLADGAYGTSVAWSFNCILPVGVPADGGA